MPLIKTSVIQKKEKRTLILIATKSMGKFALRKARHTIMYAKTL
jgi:hypothetical protein